MEENLSELIAESNRLSKENAEELRRIRKELKWMSILRIAVWLILAGVPVFVYLNLVKPPLERVFGM